jgi:hypothetical protein
MPKAVTADLVQTSLVVVDGSGNVFTKSRALAEIVRVLPFGAPITLVMRLPGISQLLDVLYDAFAARRTRVSELCGLNACGIPIKADDSDTEDESTAIEVPSAVRLMRMVTGLAREAGVVVLFVAALAQTTKENPLPFKIPQGDQLAAVVAWPRMLSKWNVLDVPSEDGVFVVDGLNRKGASVDPLTGVEPAVQADSLNARKLGQLWNDYLGRVHLRELEPFQKAFRDYLIKGGPFLEGRSADELLTGYDAYWVRYSIAAPGQSPMRTVTGQNKVFTHSRGGKLAIDRIPLIKPDVMRRPE